jgi:Fungal specific transcription factor domain
LHGFPADNPPKRYPFGNYWTQNGGVSEVLSFFPHKKQADMYVFRSQDSMLHAGYVFVSNSLNTSSLVNIFFQAVDPVYPLISRERFYTDYEGFWELDDSKKLEVDIDFIALTFMILAMGTQFLQGPDPTGQVKDGAEFYSSACYQSLRLFSYLNRTSVRCLQSMVFMTYFLLNSGRASDGWAFSGTLIRQAYAGGINREPTLISPKFTKFERLERRRLWHGIVCQDSFMSMSLRLPPTAIHFDVDNAAPMLENDESFFTDASFEAASEDLNHDPSHSDIGYVQSMYSLALLAQETISTPRSLSLPVASTPRQRNQLLARFRVCYRSFPDAFRAWDEETIAEKARQGKKRLVRQIMFLTGLYWHCLALIQSEGLEDVSFLPSSDEGAKSPAGNVDNWVRGTLDAAYQSMRAFFTIYSVLGGESSVWWAFCHRAFSVSVRLLLFFSNRYILMTLLFRVVHRSPWQTC